MFKKVAITWEVVCLQQLIQSFFPTVVEHKIVPLWDDVAKRTAMRALAKWNTAFHTPCCLYPQSLADVPKIIDFFPIFQSLLCKAIHPCLSLVLNKTPTHRQTNISFQRCNEQLYSKFHLCLITQGSFIFRPHWQRYFKFLPTY